jgi:hypothetical protein
MTARIRITLADHSALRSWNAQTAQSAQKMQGGLQTTLTKVSTISREGHFLKRYESPAVLKC